MKNSINKIFVTGGSGFIGSHLVDKLVQEKYAVTVFARESSRLSFLPLEKISIIRGNLKDYHSLKEGMRGHDSVFHLAAKASDWGSRSEFFETNVTGTQHVMKAAKENNIQKIIVVSSSGVLGEEDYSLSKKEDFPYKPKTPYFLSNIFESDMNHYRFTKMLAEEYALGFAKENNMNIVVIRPVWVFGPREFHAGAYEFCKTVLDGLRVMPMGLHNKFHVVYVKDLVAGMFKTLEKALEGIHIFNIGNTEVPEIRQYFSLFCKYLDLKAPCYAPLWIFYPAGFLLEIIAKLFKSKQPYLLTRARVKMFYCNNIYDVTKAKNELGFVPETSLEQGIKETVEWWKSNGYLKPDKGGNRALQQKYVTGFRRKLLHVRMGIIIFGKYFLLLLKRKINCKQYFIFIKRTLMFSKVLSYNKAVRIGNVYKLHLYLPGFPSKAFYKAIDKFLFLGEETIPATVVLSMTKACRYKCAHCYQKTDGGEDLSTDKLIKLAKDIQDIGVSMFDIEGGEPLLKFDRLLALIKSFDDERELWINTTGHTLTYEKALKLKKEGLFGVMISVHHWIPEKHDEFVGFKGAFEIARAAIDIFQRVGVNTVINCCPSLDMIQASGIEKILKLGRALGCSFVQIIHEKPAGGWLNKGNTMMDKVLLDSLCKKHVDLNKIDEFKNCPSLSMQVFESSPIVFGCTAGGIERFYVNAHGEVQPCEFLNISIGNIQEENFIEIYKRMRKQFKKPGLNWLCNTENYSLAHCVKENSLKSLPIKKEKSASIIQGWDKGAEVPLYKRMRSCETI